MDTVLQNVSPTIGDEKELAQRIQSGDSTAFGELYAMHKQPVYLYCVRFLGRQPVAEDVFQDVFMHCFEQLRTGRDIGNIRGYLLTSARNRCFNVIRDRKYPEDVDDMDEILPAHDPDTGERMDLEQALQTLPVPLREALLLSEYEGYTYDEIAGLTGVPLSTVRKRIFRARHKLRGLLQMPARGRQQ